MKFQENPKFHLDSKLLTRDSVPNEEAFLLLDREWHRRLRTHVRHNLPVAVRIVTVCLQACGTFEQKFLLQLDKRVDVDLPKDDAKVCLLLVSEDGNKDDVSNEEDGVLPRTDEDISLWDDRRLGMPPSRGTVLGRLFVRPTDTRLPNWAERLKYLI